MLLYHSDSTYTCLLIVSALLAENFVGSVHKGVQYILFLYAQLACVMYVGLILGVCGGWQGEIL